MSLGAVLGLPADPSDAPCPHRLAGADERCQQGDGEGGTTSRSYCSPRCTRN